MKQSILHKTAAICAAFLILALGVAAQNSTRVEPKPGTVYTYNVRANTQQYTLTVTLNEYRPTLKLNWVKAGTVNQKGSVSVGSGVASDAKTFNTVFNTAPKAECVIWMSQVVYKLLKSNAVAAVVFDNAPKADELRNTGTGEYSVTVNGALVNIPYIKAASATKEVLLQDAIHNALVLRLYTEGLSMELKSITQ